MTAAVVAVHSDPAHAFSKTTQTYVELVAGQGVRGDAHFGVKVKHRSRVARDPSQPNLRQIHLLHSELLVALASSGFAVSPGQMGENVTTSGIDLLALAEGTLIQLGRHAVVQITGLRNPCSQIENFKSGLLAAVLPRAPNGQIVRKAGVMAVVISSGIVRPNDELAVTYEPPQFKALQPV